MDIALILDNNFLHKKTPWRDLDSGSVCKNKLILSLHIINPMPFGNKISKYNHSPCSVSQQLLRNLTSHIDYSKLEKKNCHNLNVWEYNNIKLNYDVFWNVVYQLLVFVQPL